jgi:hypothetical protein
MNLKQQIAERFNSHIAKLNEIEVFLKIQLDMLKREEQVLNDSLTELPIPYNNSNTTNDAELAQNVEDFFNDY